MTNICEVLGQRIRMYRKHQHMSQEKLAELSGLHPTYIGQMERGEKNPTIESLYKICTALHIPITLLVEKLDEYTVHPDFPYTLIMDDRSNLPLQAYELFTKESVENQEKITTSSDVCTALEEIVLP